MSKKVCFHPLGFLVGVVLGLVTLTWLSLFPFPQPNPVVKYELRSHSEEPPKYKEFEYAIDKQTGDLEYRVEGDPNWRVLVSKEDMEE